MARKLRVEYPGALDHVFNRGDRQTFVEALAAVCARTGWQVNAYVLMPNHFHFVVERRPGRISSRA